MDIKFNSRFRLVEFLLFVTVLAIILVIGLSAYRGVQAEARDARRREDIDLIAKTLEAVKDQNSLSYFPIYSTSFASGYIPTDPNNAEVVYEYSSPAIVAPAGKWSITPTLGYNAINSVRSINTTLPSFRVCAWLETSLVAYCRVNLR